MEAVEWGIMYATILDGTGRYRGTVLCAATLIDRASSALSPRIDAARSIGYGSLSRNNPFARIPQGALTASTVMGLAKCAVVEVVFDIWLTLCLQLYKLPIVHQWSAPLRMAEA